MSETKVKIGLTTEVTRISMDKSNEYNNSYSPIMYKKNFVQLEMSNKRSKEDEDGKCRGWRCVPTTLYSWALVFLTFVFLVSAVGTIITWGTELWDETVLQNMVLRNNSAKYDWWVKSPVRPKIALRIFNYTNTERFMDGLEKPRVQEVGPFVYRETLERINVIFNANGTVSYQERRSYEYVPELSKGSLTDYVVVPNMALLGASSLFRDLHSFLQFSVSMAFMSINVTPFIRVQVKDFLWGYEDPLLLASKTLMISLPYDKIGLMVMRNGTSPHRITINTGANDMSRLGVVDRYRGRDRHDTWASDQCNRIDGTDGSFFPPHWVGEKETLNIYMPDMCRKFPLVFKEYVEVHGGIPAMRFHAPRDVFGHTSTNPENACFCDSDSCPPAGVFNASPCSLGTPIMISFPHFYLGDPSLLETVDGLEPREDKHDMYFDMHPKYGFPMDGVSRFQLNFMVRKSKIADLDSFTERSILPIAWFDAGLMELPQDVTNILYHMTYTRRSIELGLLITAIVTGLILGGILSRRLFRTCSSQRAGRVADVYRCQAIMAPVAPPTTEKEKTTPDLS